MTTRQPPSFLAWTRHGMPALVALVAVSLCGCPHKPVIGGATDGGPPQGNVTLSAVGPYFSVIPGPLAGSDMPTALVGTNASCSGSLFIATGDLDMVSVPTSTGQKAAVYPIATGGVTALNSIAVSGSGDPRVMFLEPTPGLMVVEGALEFSNLTVPPSAPQAVPEPGNALPNIIPEGGFAFGAGGNEMLFIDYFSSVSGAGGSSTGWLEWSSGSGVTTIGKNAAINGIVLSADRSTALAIVNVEFPGALGSTASTVGLGDLMLVNMKTGTSQMINPSANGATEHVRVLAESYGLALAACSASPPVLPLPSDCALLDTGDPAYSINANGTVAAFELNGVVQVVKNLNGAISTMAIPCPTGDYCRFPGVSPLGDEVAFFAVDTSASGSSAGNSTIQVYVISGNTPSKLIAWPASGLLTPVFSPDEEFVAYFSNLDIAGSSPSFGNEMGTVSVFALPSSGNLAPAAPIVYGSNALWRSLAFWPPSVPDTGPSQTQEISMLSNMHLPDAPSANAGGVGDLLVDNPYEMFSQSPPKPTAAKGTCIAPSDFGGLAGSGGFVFFQASPCGGTSLNPWVWTPGATSAGNGTTLKSGSMTLTDPASGSLRTSGQVPALAQSSHPVDLAIFWTNAAPTTQPCDPRSGKLYGYSNSADGGSNGEAQFLVDNVISSALTPDGRAIVIVAPNSADASTNEIEVLEF